MLPEADRHSHVCSTHGRIVDNPDQHHRHAANGTGPLKKLCFCLGGRIVSLRLHLIAIVSVRLRRRAEAKMDAPAIPFSMSKIKLYA